MMQEVGSDDPSSESTFEFVEEKVENLTLSEASSQSINVSTTSPAAGDSQPTETNTSVPHVADIPPPSSLPSFANNPLSSSTETTASFPTPLSSTLPPGPPLAYTGGAPTSLPSNYQPSQPIAAPTALLQNYPPSQPVGFPGGQIPNQPYAQGGYIQQPTIQAGGDYMQQPVQAQPVPMYAAVGSSSTSVELPFSDYDLQQPHPLASPTGDRSGLFGWIKDTVSGSDFLTKVAEKAKSSVDTMITTLDPQMKDYLYSGGDVDILVASDKESKIGAVRDAFQLVFGRATVNGVGAQAIIAEQPVGFPAGLKGAEERINFVRQSGLVQPHQAVVAIEGFLAELTPDRWYDMACIVLQDMNRSVTLHMYTQPTPVPADAVQQAQDETPPDYPMRWSGFSTTIGRIMSQKYQVPHKDWHLSATSVERREMILMSAKCLATQYKMVLCNQA